MARSISQIYESIITEKNTMATLKDKLLNEDGSSAISTEQDLLTRLTTTSKVAIWKLIFYVISVVMYLQETLWDTFKTNVETIIASAFVGTLAWWETKAKAFQYGDTLTVDTTTYAVGYSIIDTTKQIVEHSAAIERGGIVYLKIRRKNTDILSGGELTAFEGYVSKLKFAGTRVVIYNLSADDIKLYYEVFYDPIIALTTIQPLVEAAINTYIKNIPFNGELDINQLNVNLKAITGVKAVRFISGEGKNSSAPYVAFDNYYTSVAGYCQIASAFPLSGSITYTKKY